MENKYLKSLNEKISTDRIIVFKDGKYRCKFCKEHPDDCFCNDDSKLKLEGYNKGFKDGKQFALHETKDDNNVKGVAA